MATLFLLAVSASLLAVDPATEPLTPAAVDPCAEDVARLCPGVKPGGGRVAGCLRKHESELGAACREKVERDVERARQFVREFGQDCKADIERLCPAIEPGEGRILGCLGQRLPDLSGACQARLERFGEARVRVARFREACSADVERLCAPVAGQAGALLE